MEAPSDATEAENSRAASDEAASGHKGSIAVLVLSRLAKPPASVCKASVGLASFL